MQNWQNIIICLLFIQCTMPYKTVAFDLMQGYATDVNIIASEEKICCSVLTSLDVLEYKCHTSVGTIQNKCGAKVYLITSRCCILHKVLFLTQGFNGTRFKLNFWISLVLLWIHSVVSFVCHRSTSGYFGIILSFNIHLPTLIWRLPTMAS